ncbi:MAG: CarD family transcriptional regulator [Pseudomonadota bacterium]|nr:CarD family transcriptional regulator [Pseudomonadota bacterium]
MPAPAPATSSKPPTSRPAASIPDRHSGVDAEPQLTADAAAVEPEGFAPDAPPARGEIPDLPGPAVPKVDTPPSPGFAAPLQEAAPEPPPTQARPPNLHERLPPRPPAKAEVFVEGDHVVYPTHGVGKVERIAAEEIAGHKLELIHITFEENRMTLRVPVAKARSAGLRKLATRKLFDEAMAVLKGRARIKRTMWSRRAQEYEAKINSGDPLAIAEVVRDLHRNAGQPDQSFSERQIYEAAMDRLAAELAALDRTDKSTASVKLVDFLKTL